MSYFQDKMEIERVNYVCENVVSEGVFSLHFKKFYLLNINDGWIN